MAPKGLLLAALVLSPAPAAALLTLEVDGCRDAWKPADLAERGLKRKFWDGQCAKGLTPKQIRALAAPSAPKPAPPGGGAAAPLAAVKGVGDLNAAVIGALKEDVAQLYGEYGAKSGWVPAPAAVSVVVSVADDSPQAGAKAAPRRAPSKEVPRPAPNACSAPFSGGPPWYQATSQQLACLPGVPYRRAFLDLFARTGLHNYFSDHVGASNEGLNNFYDSLAKKNPEFAAQVALFYERVQVRQRVYDAKHSYFQKASLQDAAGEGANRDVEPGWAWKEALDVAKGDTNRAMRLIGFCGHDDVFRSTLEKPRTPEAARAALEEKKHQIRDEIAQLKRGLKNAPCPVSNDQKSAPPILSLDEPTSPEAICQKLGDERRRLSDLKLEDFLVEKAEVCPFSNSIYYLPRSLDRGADISDALKKRVAKTQKGSEEKLNAIPAKYYHVLGAAASACELIRNGAPAWLAETVQGKAAWAYRTLRMKTDAELYQARREELGVDYERYRRGLAKGEAPLDEEAWRERRNEDELADGDRVSLSRMDAFELMERWGYGGKVFGKELPPLDFRVGWLAGKFFKSRPAGWSDKRFAAAKERLETFFIDWEWTVAEHKAGAAFAAKVCREEKAP